jgi:hypothetical protein
MKSLAAPLMLLGICVALVRPAYALDVSASVLTQHNDNHRTGAYLHETALTPALVERSFGRVAEINVDGVISAQPLFVSKLDIPGSPDAAFVATNNNSIYRLLRYPLPRSWTATRLWPRVGREPAGAVTMPGMVDEPKLIGHKPCSQTRWPVGIVSTPVIDARTNTLYFVYRTGTAYSASTPWPNPIDAHWKLAAIDIRDGRETKPAVEIGDKDPRHPGRRAEFAPDMQLNRPGLLLSKGQLYIAFGAAVCDSGGNQNIDARKKRWHGWVFAYDAATLDLTASVNTSPTGSGAGIWQSGNGLAAGDDGSVYAMTGNVARDFLAPNDGDSFLRLRLQGQGELSIAPFQVGNHVRLDTGEPHSLDPKVSAGSDSDLGAGGPLILPNGFIAGGGKQGSLYVLSPPPTVKFRQGFQAFFNSWHPEIDPCDYDAAQANGPNIHGAPVVWHPSGTSFSWLYGMPEKDYLTAYRVDSDGHIQEHPSRTTVDIGERAPDFMPGGFLSISANGGADGIVWASVGRKDSIDGAPNDISGRLIAFDATTLRKLWADDADEGFTKFVPPTIGGGSVFRAVAKRIGTKPNRYVSKIIIYGLRDAATPVETDRAVVIPPIREVSAAWRNPNHLDLFAATLHSGEVVSTSLGNPRGTPPEFATCPPGWRGWFPVASAKPVAAKLQLANTAPVSAVWRDRTRLNLFTTAAAGGIVTAWWQTTGAAPELWNTEGWQAVPNTPAAPPGTPVTAVRRPIERAGSRVDGPTRLDLFVAVDGAVKSTGFDADGWRPWFAVRPESGKTVVRAPVTAVWRNRGHLDLFMSDTAGHVVSTYFANDAWQPSWFPLMPTTGVAKPGAPVTAVWREPDHERLDLFMTDVAGHVVNTYFEHDRWQPAWSALDAASLQAQPG